MAGDGNILTDSLVQKQQLNKDGKQEQKSVNTFVTEGPAIGSTGPQQGQGASALWRRQRRGPRTGGQSGENPSEDPAAVPDQAQTIAIFDPMEAAGGTAGNAAPGQIVAAAPGLFPGAPGDKERTIEWLEKGLEARDSSLIYLGVMPLRTLRRDDPHFQSLLRRIGLPL